MKANNAKLVDMLFHDVKATLGDGPQDYIAVTDETGKLLAWSMKHANEWAWVHKNFRR